MSKFFATYSIVLVAVTATTVTAEPLRPDEYTVIKPTGMNDAASIKGPPSWCPARYTGDVWDKGRLRRGVGSNIGPIWIEAAAHICQWANDPTWQKQAGYLVQAVMNQDNISQAQAEAQIKEMIAKARGEQENAGREPTDEERFAFSPGALTPFAAERGIDTAKLTGAPAWCDKAQINEKWDPGRISRTVGQRYGIGGLIEGALHICQRPNDPTWRTEARHILQQWMNWTRLPQPEAEASLRARIQGTKFASDRAALCKNLEYSRELGGQARAYAKAHQRFFGCESDYQPLWLDQTTAVSDEVGFYFDLDDQHESEIMRLYWLFRMTQSPDEELPGSDERSNLPLLNYAVAQWDYARLETPTLATLLAKAPYNNDYARTVVSESLGHLKWRRKVFEVAVDKLARSDKDYAAILRGAPKQGFADWDKLVAQWKPELARSNAFERKLSLPSRKELAGCATELHADAEKVIRSLKETTYNGLVAKVAGDPIASLLLDRLAVCYVLDGVSGGSGALRDLAKQGRDLRGPRSLAYYAIVDAIAAIQKDRPRLLVGLTSFYYRTTRLVDLYGSELTFSGRVLPDPEKQGRNGVAKSVTKVAEGLKIVFKTETVRYPEQVCVETNKPMKINLDGRIEYYTSCKPTGKMLSRDVTPSPLVISPRLASGVKPGVFVVGAAGAKLDTVIFTKKTAAATKIQTFYGFAL